jgi:predicted unusual protein kinase regulating ubiquinone biosynthesis (AarF/ABC1/UbiB family)
LAARRLLGLDPGARDDRLGEHLTAQLDQMKGMAMKVGQIVSYLDVPLPESVQARMAQLQRGQRGMSPQVAIEVLERSLNAPVSALFDRFDPVPIAAASIGQVHRAALDGQELAVKLQYPDIASSFSDDLGALHRVAGLAGMASAVDGHALVDELAARLEEECDYHREAIMQTAFAEAFSHDPRIQVPAVLRERCSDTVLTSHWVDGETFEELKADPDEPRRTAVAETLVRFSFRSLLVLGTIQADPHPGNYIFQPDGPTTFLDFGCVRQLDIEFVELLRAMIETIRDDDRRRFRDVVTALGLVGKPKRFDFDHFFTMMEHLYRPLLAERFHFSPEYTREGFAHNGPTNPNARTMSIPPAFLWVLRLQSGLWAVLSRLAPAASYRTIADELLAQPISPLPTSH